MVSRFGYVALLGRANAGKSTLLNACVGQKVVGVSKRPQTTRNKIIGISSRKSSQFAILDTPGIQRQTRKLMLNQAMNKQAWSVLEEADVLCYLVDATVGWHREDSEFFSKILSSSKLPLMVLATKSDSAKKSHVHQGLMSIQEGIKEASGKEEADAPSVMLISSKSKESVEAFKDCLSDTIPQGQWLFDEDDLTDKSENFIVSEMIREQLFRKLGEELPYGACVLIDRLKETSNLVAIDATIVVSKESHKPIVIGKKGSLIKEIGQLSRLSLEQHFQQKVFLKLFVKVKKNWIENSQLIESYQNI